MLRAILAVIIGYAVIFAFVFTTLSIAFIAMGTDGAFKEDLYDVSTGWLLVSFVLGFIAAVLGGIVCALIARGGRPPKVLAGFVLVFGLLLAVPTLMTSKESQPKIRPPDVSNWEAMQNARTPPVEAFLNPFIGAAGVLLGARLVSGRPRADTQGA